MGHSDEREIYSTKCSHLEKSESLKLVIKIAFSKNEKHSKINPKPEKGRKQKKTRAIITEIEIRKAIEKTNETKSGSSKKSMNLQTLSFRRLMY